MEEYLDEINDESLEDATDPNDSQELFEHFKFVADKGQTLLRVDKFLSLRIENASRNRIQNAADAGFILANGESVKSNYKVKPNDVITIVMDRPRRTIDIIPENIPLDIVYQDIELMVVNKPPGLVVHPGHGNYSGTMANAIAWLFKNDLMFDAIDPRPGIIHRIDKDTSGLLVIAKNPDSKADLSYQFYRKSTKRQYVALVWGNVKNDEGTIDEYIGRHLKDKLLMTVFPTGEHGKPAVTRYKVLERFGYVTLVECQLETGRTHQIRVHMKHIGHTIFNDARYGGDEILKGTTSTKYKQFVQNCFEICPRQALHARTLGFVHPETRKELFFEAEIPEDMTRLIEKWRAYSHDVNLV